MYIWMILFLMNALFDIKMAIPNFNMLFMFFFIILCHFCLTVCTIYLILRLCSTVAHECHLVLQKHHLPIVVKCSCLDNVTYPFWHHNGYLVSHLVSHFMNEAVISKLRYSSDEFVCVGRRNACQSHPTPINAVKISMQNAVFYNNNMQCLINKS